MVFFTGLKPVPLPGAEQAMRTGMQGCFSANWMAPDTTTLCTGANLYIQSLTSKIATASLIGASRFVQEGRSAR